MIQETVKVAIDVVDGPVAIMDLVVVGRGDILPVHAEWIEGEWVPDPEDKVFPIKPVLTGYWRREPTDEVIREQIARGQQSYLGPVSGYRIIDPAEVPKDRTFRDAWKHSAGKVEVDMPEARKIHLERVRVARASVLDQLDRDWMKATGQGKKADADGVEAKRQRLRDLTTTLGVENAQTPEALKAIWDPELGPQEA